jgi:hypothetical protein
MGKTTAWLNAYVMREFFHFMPNQVENITSIRESLFCHKENARRYAGLYGETVFAIFAWEYESLMEDMALFIKQVNGIQFLHWIDDFTPGLFKRATLSLKLPTHHFPKAGHHLRRYLQDKYVPVNLLRVQDGYKFDVPKKARQKRIFYKGSFIQNDTFFLGEIVISQKFDLRDYLKSFAEPFWSDEAVVEVKNLEF